MSLNTTRIKGTERENDMQNGDGIKKMESFNQSIRLMTKSKEHFPLDCQFQQRMNSFNALLAKDQRT